MGFPHSPVPFENLGILFRRASKVLFLDLSGYTVFTFCDKVLSTLFCALVLYFTVTKGLKIVSKTKEVWRSIDL